MTTERERHDAKRFMRRLEAEHGSAPTPIRKNLGAKWWWLIGSGAFLAALTFGFYTLEQQRTVTVPAPRPAPPARQVEAPVATQLSGKVISIADGDTLTILAAGNQQVKIRLAEIDTPESGQPFGNRSKQALSKLAGRQSVTVEVQDIDQYGRTVGRVYVGDVDVSAELVREGYAWVYRKYLRDRTLLDLEAGARADKRGLWALPDNQRVPPWEWRSGERTAPGYAPPDPACPIKGNISKSGRIYHVPGMPSYARTKISPEKGERWFCSEEEARAAGWRPPRG